MPTIIGDALPNIPWEDKPAGYPHVCWRYSGNPIIPRDAFPTANSIFNSAAVPYRDRFAGVFRCDSTDRFMQLHVGHSEDGIRWTINPERIRFQADDPEMARWEYGYDPRVVWI